MILLAGFVKPAHPGYYVFLANHFDSNPQGLRHRILHPIILIPYLQPTQRHCLRDSGVYEVVARVGEV